MYIKSEQYCVPQDTVLKNGSFNVSCSLVGNRSPSCWQMKNISAVFPFLRFCFLIIQRLTNVIGMSFLMKAACIVGSLLKVLLKIRLKEMFPADLLSRDDSLCCVFFLFRFYTFLCAYSRLINSHLSESACYSSGLFTHSPVSMGNDQ